MANGANILIVEDEAIAGLVLADALERAGFMVRGPALTLAEALALAAEPPAPDLALMDIRLLGEGDGVAAARALKARGVPSLFVTSQARAALANRDAALGLLSKPFSGAELTLAVEAALAFAAGAPPRPAPSGLELFTSAE